MPCQCLPLAEPSSEQNSNRTRWYSLQRLVFWDTSKAQKIRKQMVQWGLGKMCCCFLNKGYKYGKEWKHLNGKLSLPPWQMEERKLREVVLPRLSARKRNRFGALYGASGLSCFPLHCMAPLRVMVEIILVSPKQFLPWDKPRVWKFTPPAVAYILGLNPFAVVFQTIFQRGFLKLPITLKGIDNRKLDSLILGEKEG